MTVASALWFVAVESVNTSSFGWLVAWWVVIPLKPLTQPVNVFAVNPVYVITSSLILNRPYSFGKPLVLLTFTTVEVVVIPLVSIVSPTTTSGVKLSNFMYWSKLSVRSIGPPWYSWENIILF